MERQKEGNISEKGMTETPGNIAHYDTLPILLQTCKNGRALTGRAGRNLNQEVREPRRLCFDSIFDLILLQKRKKAAPIVVSGEPQGSSISSDLIFETRYAII
jgi:hypothetical protein